MDTVRHIAGEVADANIHTLRGLGGAAGWYAIDLGFKDGASGRIDVLPTAGVLEETYELIGEGYRAIVTCPFGPERGWRGYRENRLVVEESAQGTPEDVLNGCYDEAVEFIRAVGIKKHPRPSIEDVYPSVELCLAMARQAEQTAGNLIPAKSDCGA